MLNSFLNTHIIISYGMYPIICIQNHFVKLKLTNIVIWLDVKINIYIVIQ